MYLDASLIPLWISDYILKTRYVRIGTYELSAMRDAVEISRSRFLFCLLAAFHKRYERVLWFLALCAPRREL